MSHGYVRALAIVAATVLMLGTPHAVRAVDPATAAGPTDITSTDRGSDLAIEAADRFSSYGVPTDPGDLTVLEYGDGRVFVAPDSLLPTLDGAIEGEGEAVASVDVRAGPSPRHASAPGSRHGGSRARESASPYWSLREQGCLASLAVDSARLDSCYAIYKLINDGSLTRSYWVLRHRGTAFEYESGLRSAWISGQRTPGTASQTWVDWGPEQGHSGSCSTVGIGVSHIASLSFSAKACETWSIDKSCNTCTPFFRNTWDCSCWFGLATKEDPISRAVAYQVLVSMANASTPGFRLGIGIAA